MLGLSLAVLLHTACTNGAWANLGFNGLLRAVLPACVVGACQRWIESRLPHNLFVFMIGNGMFTTLLATAVTGGLAFLVASTVGAAPGPIDVRQYFGPILLLAWSEAIVSGMLFCALAVFAPHLVLTYRQDRYLPALRSGGQ
jgi:uncharacterized membrane protein